MAVNCNNICGLVYHPHMLVIHIIKNDNLAVLNNSSEKRRQRHVSVEKKDEQKENFVWQKYVSLIPSKKKRATKRQNREKDNFLHTTSLGYKILFISMVLVNKNLFSIRIWTTFKAIRDNNKQISSDYRLNKCFLIKYYHLILIFLPCMWAHSFSHGIQRKKFPTTIIIDSMQKLSFVSQENNLSFYWNIFVL